MGTGWSPNHPSFVSHPCPLSLMFSAQGTILCVRIRTRRGGTAVGKRTDGKVAKRLWWEEAIVVDNFVGFPCLGFSNLHLWGIHQH